MWSLLARILRGVFSKAFLVAGVVGLSLLGLALYLYSVDRYRDLQDDKVSFQREHQLLLVEVQDLEREARQRIDAALAAVERVRSIEERLERLRSLWQSVRVWFGADDSELRRLEAERERLLAEKRAQVAAAEESRSAWETAQARLERLGRDLGMIEDALRPWDYFRQVTRTYVGQAWDRLRWPLTIAVLAILFGPTLWRLFLYYLWGPLLLLSRPVLLDDQPAGQPVAAGDGVSRALCLAPDWEVVTREKFLQSKDEALRKGVCWMLDWRYPFTSLSSGLVELVRLRNRTATDLGIVFSAADEPTTEMLEIVLAQDARLVLRPSFVAAVIQPIGHRLRLRTRWRLWHLHAWITLQFRYFEWSGPCRLLLRGNRGVRVEQVASGRPRRTNAAGTIGFSPNLAYHSVRAETFWSYYRGMNPLFDDLFTGEGVFLCQEVSSLATTGDALTFWRRLWEGLLKVFGL